jgi:hypothetical protein
MHLLNYQDSATGHWKPGVLGSKDTLRVEFVHPKRRIPTAVKVRDSAHQEEVPIPVSGTMRRRIGTEHPSSKWYGNST